MNFYEKNIIQLRDEIKDKSYDKLINMLPFWVCKEQYVGEYNDKPLYVYHSYRAIGFGKQVIILKDESDELIELPFDSINGDYICANECTDKQYEFLEKYSDEDPDVICGYHAYHIIHDKIECWKQNKTYKENSCWYDAYDIDDYNDTSMWEEHY